MDASASVGGFANRMKLPRLTRVSDIVRHLMISETLALELNVSTDSMSFKLPLITSLEGHPAVADMASDLITLPYSDIKRSLVSCFASARINRGELDRRIEDLQWDLERTPNEIRSLYNFFLQVNAISPISESDFCFRVFTKCVPDSLLVELIRSCHHSHPSQIWHTIHPLALCEELDTICFIRGQISCTLPRNRQKKSPSVPDRALRTQPHQPQGQSRPSSWISALAQKHHAVYFVNKYSAETIRQILAAAAEHFEMKRRDGSGVYYVVAFRDAKSSAVMHSLEQGAYRQVQKN